MRAATGENSTPKARSVATSQSLLVQKRRNPPPIFVLSSRSLTPPFLNPRWHIYTNFQIRVGDPVAQ